MTYKLNYNVLADNLTKSTYDNSWSAVGTSTKGWIFGKNDFYITTFIIFVYNVM